MQFIIVKVHRNSYKETIRLTFILDKFDVRNKLFFKKYKFTPHFSCSL